MGTIIKAVCTCGLESDTIHQGIGFRYFENGVRIEPAYCDSCGIVVGRDISKSFSKCPQCRRKVKFYTEDVEESDEKVPGLATDDYLDEKEFWHCPRCKRETLRFKSLGLWD
jgi:predicted Zn-ribbon and HTH transcriptional regulator